MAKETRQRRTLTGNQFLDPKRCLTEVDIQTVADEGEMVDGFRNPYYHNRDDSVRLKT